MGGLENRQNKGGSERRGLRIGEEVVKEVAGGKRELWEVVKDSGGGGERVGEWKVDL